METRHWCTTNKYIFRHRLVSGLRIDYVGLDFRKPMELWEDRMVLTFVFWHNLAVSWHGEDDGLSTDLMMGAGPVNALCTA